MTAIPKPVRVRNESRLAWCRKQPCILEGPDPLNCRGEIDAHHIRAKGQGGVGTKPSDFRTLPCCRAAHEYYHHIGRDAFEKEFGIDLERLIREHNARYQAEVKPRPKKPREVKTVKTFAQCPHCRKEHRLKIPSLTFFCPRIRTTIQVS